MTFIKGNSTSTDPVYPVNSCFTQISEWRTKNTSLQFFLRLDRIPRVLHVQRNLWVFQVFQVCGHPVSSSEIMTLSLCCVLCSSECHNSCMNLDHGRKTAELTVCFPQPATYRIFGHTALMQTNCHKCFTRTTTNSILIPLHCIAFKFLTNQFFRVTSC